MMKRMMMMHFDCRRPLCRYRGAIGGASAKPRPLQQTDPSCDEWLRTGYGAADGVVGAAHQRGECTSTWAHGPQPLGAGLRRICDLTFVFLIALNQELILICVAKRPLTYFYFKDLLYFFLFLQHEREQVMTTNVWLTQVRALPHSPHCPFNPPEAPI